MIARRKVAFLRLCGILREIEADLDRIDLVKDLNLKILKEILGDEQHIVKARKELKELNRELKSSRLEKVAANSLRHSIRKRENSILRYQKQIYIWKCIGDGIAYAYIDPFSLKHAFFDTVSEDPKQSSGFISGKTGLTNELALLLNALDHNVPAVLSDATNVIRYGDICLLGGSDPVPIEVKSRSRVNQRGKRQAAKLEQLETFLQNDYAEGFRGGPHVARREIEVAYRDCTDSLNQCIAEAMEKGHCVAFPEQGLAYIAIWGSADIPEIFEKVNFSKPVLVMLNQDKTDQNWAPYLPFVLSIRNIKHLYQFVVGNLNLMVVFDAAAVCDAINPPGWTVSFVEDERFALVFEHAETGCVAATSRQFVMRLAFEFMSLEWFGQQESASLQSMLRELSEREPKDASLIEIPVNALRDLPRIVQRNH